MCRENIARPSRIALDFAPFSAKKSRQRASRRSEIHFAEKDSRQTNSLEQILIAKVFNFGGICSNRKMRERPAWPDTRSP
jgi:hypothetical protein